MSGFNENEMNGDSRLLTMPDEQDENDTLDVLEDPNLDGTGDSNLDLQIEDPELEDIKARVREMEEEAAKLKQMQNEVEKQMNLASPSLNFPSVEEKIEADARSIYVGNVDYGATAEELEYHFHGCGPVNRVTILVDKFTGKPKGFAYIEFADKESMNPAIALDESLFRGRQIKVNAKRTNQPGISTTNRRPRGFGGRVMRRPSYSHFGASPYAPYAPRRATRFRYVWHL
ncbi:unnamed protein product [Gordionus sp. m RMFG-2023]